MAPEFGGPVIVSREPGVVRELRPFNTFSNNNHFKRFPGAELNDLHLVSPELPRKVEAWSPEEEENWDQISANSKVTHWLGFSTRYWLLPVILKSCWVPMPGCLRITAQNLLPESEYISS